MAEVAEAIIEAYYCRDKGGCEEFLRHPGGR